MNSTHTITLNPPAKTLDGDILRWKLLDAVSTTNLESIARCLPATSQRDKAAYNYIEIGDVNVGDGAASFNRIEVGDLPANAK